MYHKICPICKKPFNTAMPNTVCCSDLCKKNRKNQQDKDSKKRAHKTQTRKTVYTKSCDNCGKVFQTACKNTKYCSHACSGDGAYLKHRESAEKNRPFTPDTVMLCHLYHHARGESIEQIARDLDRSLENVMQALSTPLNQGGVAVVAGEMDFYQNRNRP